MPPGAGGLPTGLLDMPPGAGGLPAGSLDMPPGAGEKEPPVPGVPLSEE